MLFRPWLVSCSLAENPAANESVAKAIPFIEVTPLALILDEHWLLQATRVVFHSRRVPINTRMARLGRSHDGVCFRAVPINTRLARIGRSNHLSLTYSAIITTLSKQHTWPWNAQSCKLMSLIVVRLEIFSPFSVSTKA